MVATESTLDFVQMRRELLNYRKARLINQDYDEQLSNIGDRRTSKLLLSSRTTDFMDGVERSMKNKTKKVKENAYGVDLDSFLRIRSQLISDRKANVFEEHAK